MPRLPSKSPQLLLQLVPRDSLKGNKQAKTSICNPDFTVLTLISIIHQRAESMFVRITVFWIECMAHFVLSVLRSLASSPVIQALALLLVQAIAYILTQLLTIPVVRKALGDLIAEGMNAFLQQPNLDEHLLQMVETMNKTQPELARQQGRAFPILVGNFLQGMLLQSSSNSSSNKINNKNSNHANRLISKPSRIEAHNEQFPHAPQRTLSIPILQQSMEESCTTSTPLATNPTDSTLTEERTKLPSYGDLIFLSATDGLTIDNDVSSTEDTAPTF